MNSQLDSPLLSDYDQVREPGLLDDGACSGTPDEAQTSTKPPSPPPGPPQLQVSSIFNFYANLVDSPSDTLILSSDGIFFVVHFHILLQASTNNLAGLPILTDVPMPGTDATLLATESSHTLTVVLLSLYNLPYNPSTFSFPTLLSALPALAKYGLTPLQKYISRRTPLFDAILHHAPLHALETFALASATGLEELAVAASAYTLPIPPHTIPLKFLHLIGTRYFHRLCQLHGSRVESLKAWLDEPVYPHVAKPYCSPEKRKEVGLRYGVACAEVYYRASPAMTKATIEGPVRQLINSLECPDCKETLEVRLNDMCRKWLLLPRTI